MLEQQTTSAVFQKSAKKYAHKTAINLSHHHFCKAMRKQNRPPWLENFSAKHTKI